MKKKPRVFIGLREVAGYFSGLKNGFDLEGIDCAFMNLGGNRFNYESGKNPKWVKLFNKIGQKIGSLSSKNFILRFIWLSTFQNIFSLIAFFIAIFRYDVFIFGGSSTFFFFIDYYILKLLGKKVICVYLGSDSRPVYLNGYAFNGEGNLKALKLLTRIQKFTVRVAERNADFIIQHPPQSQFNIKPFISWLDIGIPCTTPDLVSKVPNPNNKIKIVHVPSKTGPKGSHLFQEIVDNLKKKYEFEYVKISGVSHHKVLELISTADLALDEFYSDTPMAVFATECAFQKVPVVVGSFYANDIKFDYEPAQLPPSAFVLPENIEEAIEELILNKEKRDKLGQEAFNYVTENWSSNIVARKFLSLINNDFPKSWIYDPMKFNYYWGCGLNKEQLLKNLKALYTGKENKRGWMLEEKPLLNDEYLNMINEKK